MTRLYRLLFVAALATPGTAFAVGPPTGNLRAATPDAVEKNPEQYMMSCAPGPTYGMTMTTVGDCKTVTVDGTHASQNILFRWGKQLLINNDASGAILVCAHQTLTTTTGIGTSSNLGTGGGCGPSAAGGTSLATGCVGHDGATTAAGKGDCIVVRASSSEFFKVSPSRWLSSSTPTYRGWGCSDTVGGKAVIGGPCASDADCGAGGTCNNASVALDSRRGASGVYLSICPTNAASIVQVTECRQ